MTSASRLSEVYDSSMSSDTVCVIAKPCLVLDGIQKVDEHVLSQRTTERGLQRILT